MKRYKKKKSSAAGVILVILLALLACVAVALRVLSPDENGEAKLPSSGLSELLPSAPKEKKTPSQETGNAKEEKKPEPEPVEVKDYSGMLRISELMPRNKSFHMINNGEFYDWIELENISSETVSLDGWGMSDGEDKSPWMFPDGVTVGPGGFLLVYASGRDEYAGEIHTDFSLSDDEDVILYSPSGSVECSVYTGDIDRNLSIAPDEEGEYALCSWPTPGRANTLQEYDARCAALDAPAGPLVINEVMGGNFSYAECNTGNVDWVEIKNISGSDVNLSGYWLSDDDSDYLQFNLPDRTLEPGGKILIYCDGATESTTSKYIHAPFSVDAISESLYLSSSTAVLDSIAYHDAPVNGSMGRLDGQRGFFYFSTPTPGADNENGYRRVTPKPAVIGGDGVFQDVESVTVELSSAGTVYYTTDGSRPTTSSKVYSEPFEIKSTTIVRAFAQEDGLARSKEACYSFIVNEGHTLPVLSLVADNYSNFKSMYDQGLKRSPQRASISLYEENGSFTRACCVRVKGWTSRELPKKSLGVSFNGKYGDGSLRYDLYGLGETEYEDLSIRAGQDYTFSVVRNELFQELCLEMTDHVPTQHSKYCILYINGQYWGIYCLKEDINKSYYANWTGTKKSEVYQAASPIGKKENLAYQEIIQWAMDHDLSKDEDYEAFCEIVDIDSFIDWIILEGHSANSDINGNMRYFKTEGGKWQIAFYDLDWALYYKGNCFNNTLNPSKDTQVYLVTKRLLKNDAFREKLARRAAECLKTTLSNEHVLEKLDELVAVVEPEMKREQQRWKLTMRGWTDRVEEIRKWINGKDWDEYCLKMVLGLCHVSSALRDELTS